MRDVALYMSAWIEISLIGKKQSVVDVALYMSAWIEISVVSTFSAAFVSHST